MSSPLVAPYLSRHVRPGAESRRFRVPHRPALLWKPPRVLVRRGYTQVEVWLDETDISFMKASRFSVREQTCILQLVRQNFAELLASWCSLKDDLRRGRLERNALID